MSVPSVPDPVGLIARRDVGTSIYRCPNCRVLHQYAAWLATGGAVCKKCDAIIMPHDVVTFATPVTRMLAAIVDVAAVATADFWVLLAVGIGFGWSAPHKPPPNTGDYTRNALTVLAVVSVAIIVSSMLGLLTIGNARGKTVGKLWLGIRVTELNTGAKPGLVRGVLRTGGQLITIATLGAGYALALFGAQHRALHDRIAGTIVVDD